MSLVKPKRTLFKKVGISDYSGLYEKVKNLFEVSNQFLFSGPMGSGKTTMIKKICLELGVREAVSSPTYALVNEYQGRKNEAIYHFDLYRLRDLDEIQHIGFTEYLDSGRLCLIEWPEMIKPLLEIPYFEFRFIPSVSVDHRDIELVHYE
jgi:tRNA threonylcarbamoyladenosine biosynthesis protein TsaE